MVPADACLPGVRSLTAVFERFTEQARHVVVVAQDERRGLGHNYIGTEHLLLGLMYSQGGIADQTLARFGLTAESVRGQIAAIVGSSDESVSGQVPFTPRAKKVLELGMREALNLGHNSIDTDHLLLGLLTEHEGVATRVLTESGIDIEALREAVLEQAQAVGRVAPVPAAPVPAPRGPAVRRVEPAIRVTVMPDPQVRRLLMRACARALEDDRTEFTVRDLLIAARNDDAVREVMAALGSEKTDEKSASSGEEGAEPAA